MSLTTAHADAAAPRRRESRGLDNERKSGVALRLGSLVFTAASAAALVIGWQLRHEHLVTAEQGVGYWLGIAGTTAMLLLLIYPLRKRVGGLRRIGSVAAWFRVHMMMGVVGPILILYHANFGLGSTNANVALASMLLVAGSGLIGRYLYAKVYRGSAARIMDVRQFLAALERDDISVPLSPDAKRAVLSRLQSFAAETFPDDVAATRRKGLLGFRFRRLRLAVAKDMAAMARTSRATKAQSKADVRAARRIVMAFKHLLYVAARVKTFERLFALWHVLHLPLFLLLVIAATLHIVAVHIY